MSLEVSRGQMSLRSVGAPPLGDGSIPLFLVVSLELEVSSVETWSGLVSWEC
jgi:hypothetical protein